MQFKWHLLIGFVASSILVYFFNFSIIAGLIIFLSSWLIDIDHYFWYAISAKDWNPLNAIRWYKKAIPKWFALTPKEKNKFKRGVFIFHGFLFWAILSALTLVHTLFFWILVGVAIHMLADWTDLYLRGEPLDNKLFPLYVIRRNKNKRGLNDL